MTRWTPLAILTAVAFFVLAVSHAVYEATSPQWLTWHIALRKAYSIVAFTIVGYTFVRALGARYRALDPSGRVRLACGYVATYSAAIEVAQYLHGSREGLAWNAFDIGCGALGGALAIFLERSFSRA
jgi:hypothetical protein